jgi:SAM-dependent methyltransferase
MITNERERRRWNDDLWTGGWPKREPLTGAATPALLEAARLAPGERVLDVGCGGARTSLRVARLVGPEGFVVGADISVALVALAERRAEQAGVTNVDFVLADVQVDPIPGSPFDVALSQFGVMFFEHPVTAFAAIAAHLWPEGRLAFASWAAVERNPWHFGQAMAHLVPPPPPPAPGASVTGPFALADPAVVRAILDQAGLVEVEVTEHQMVVEAPADAVVDEAQLRFNGVAPEAMGEALALARQHLSAFGDPEGTLSLPIAFHVVTARPA